MTNKQAITGGVYLVIDPAMEQSLLFTRLATALQAGIQVVQIWNNWPTGVDKHAFINAVASVCKTYNVPLLINDDWELLLRTPELTGVHFDTVPEDYRGIISKVARPFLAGVTCSGDLGVVKWAHENRLQYVSFCAMYPSPSVSSCDIVMPATVKQAKTITDLPIFVSGGITPENIIELRKLTPFNGVAVISGVMSADDPYQKIIEYHNALQQLI